MMVHAHYHINPPPPSPSSTPTPAGLYIRYTKPEGETRYLNREPTGRRSGSTRDRLQLPWRFFRKWCPAFRPPRPRRPPVLPDSLAENRLSREARRSLAMR